MNGMKKTLERKRRGKSEELVRKGVNTWTTILPAKRGRPWPYYRPNETIKKDHLKFEENLSRKINKQKSRRNKGER